jgi:hypothetical protein
LNLTDTVLTFIDYLKCSKRPHSAPTHSVSLSDTLSRDISQVRRNYRMYGVTVVKHRVSDDTGDTPCENATSWPTLDSLPVTRQSGKT